MSDLQYKIVLITGGSGELGQALAEAFATQGSRVVIAARDQARLHAAAERWRNGAQVLALACDISRRDQGQNLGQEIKGRWGDVQVLINNAGIARAVSFSDTPDDLWDRTLETNLTGAYKLLQTFLTGDDAGEMGTDHLNALTFATCAELERVFAAITQDCSVTSLS